VFTKDDYINLLIVLSRGTFTGIDEAKVAVTLEAKLQAAVKAAQPETTEE
jgi:hypothetical protein